MRNRLLRAPYAMSHPHPEAIRTELQGLAARPLISLVMPTFNTDPRYLGEAIASVRSQSYPHWELCVVDDGSTKRGTRRALSRAGARDPRIRVQTLNHNTGIAGASNLALAACRGELVGFIDHDDALTADALMRVARAFAENEIDIAYSDQDKITPRGRRADPFLKPDWSPVYALGAMYVGHFLVARRELLEEAGGFDGEFDGIQDFELILRLAERTQRIHHIPRILYHWRAIPGSIAAGTDQKHGLPELQARAVTAHLRRRGLPIEAVPHPAIPHRTRLRPLPREEHPAVSVVVVARGRSGVLQSCLSAVRERTSYPNLELVLVGLGRHRDSLRRSAEATRGDRAVSIEYPGGSYCPSWMANLGAERAHGEYLVFLEEETEVLESDWIEQLLMFAEMPRVGAVGPVLSRPDGLVEAAGFAVGLRDPAAAALQGEDGAGDGYYGSLACAHEVSALSMDCMMVSASRLSEVGGFEPSFSRQFHNLDLCMALRERRLSSVVTPSPRTLTHRPSRLRRSDVDVIDRALFVDRHYEALRAGDPYYNPGFARARADYTARPGSTDRVGEMVEALR